MWRRWSYARSSAKISKEQGRKILAAVIADFDNAWLTATEGISSESVPYLQFARQYNELLAQRVIPNFSLPVTSIDTAVYSPFLSDDIADIELFTKRFVEAGVIKNDQNIFKIIDDRQRTEMLQLAGFEPSDVLLRFARSGETIRFSELRDQGADISACKEITYIMCFANLIPVIYGDINNDPYYEPYAKAKQQVQQLGFDPIFYRIQPTTPEDVRLFPTLFDYYTIALNEENL